jgi:hypothetical protein
MKNPSGPVLCRGGVFDPVIMFRVGYPGNHPPRLCGSRQLIAAAVVPHGNETNSLCCSYVPRRMDMGDNDFMSGSNIAFAAGAVNGV